MTDPCARLVPDWLRDVACWVAIGFIMVAAEVIIFLGTQFERFVFKPIMGRGFKKRGE
jgi:hypothetical protein